jgi:hypothetical protein
MVDYEDVLSQLYSQRELIEQAIRSFEILTDRRRKRGRPGKKLGLIPRAEAVRITRPFSKPRLTIAGRSL